MKIEVIKHEWDAHTKPQIEGNVDLVFADPPYNIGVKYDDDKSGDKITEKQYMLFCNDVIRQCVDLLRPGGTLWWLCPPEHGFWVWQLLIDHGRLLYERPIIWHERFSQYQQKRLTCDYRLLFPVVKSAEVSADNPRAAEFWGKQLLTFNPDAIREESERQKMGDKRADPRGRVPGHVGRGRRLQGNAKDRIGWHPAQLPPEPLERIVKGWTNHGDTVVDAFAGSGSMGMACKKLGRSFIGLERSDQYCFHMRARLGIPEHDPDSKGEGQPVCSGL